jgi:hypothetical protein
MLKFVFNALRPDHLRWERDDIARKNPRRLHFSIRHPISESGGN